MVETWSPFQTRHQEYFLFFLKAVPSIFQGYFIQHFSLPCGSASCAVVYSTAAVDSVNSQNYCRCLFVAVKLNFRDTFSYFCCLPLPSFKAYLCKVLFFHLFLSLLLCDMPGIRQQDRAPSKDPFFLLEKEVSAVQHTAYLFCILHSGRVLHVGKLCCEAVVCPPLKGVFGSRTTKAGWLSDLAYIG